MRANAIVATAVVSFWLCSPVQANKYGSVEPIANPAVIDTSPLRDQPLRVREAFATRLLQCGIVDRVVQALSATRAITTINDLNTHVSVGAGGFAGVTNPSYVFTVIDDGPNAASIDDVKVLTDSLGYVDVAGERLSPRFGRHLELRFFVQPLRRPQLRHPTAACGFRGAVREGRQDRTAPSCSRPTRAATRNSVARISLSSRRCRRPVHCAATCVPPRHSASNTHR